MVETDTKFYQKLGVRPSVRTPKTAEVIANHIRGQIIRGELKEGDTLPPENQLLESLGISRPTLREALRVLETENFIRVVRGSRSGASIQPPQVEVVSRYAGYVLEYLKTNMADLYEARFAIEPHIVSKLAAKPTKGTIKVLRDQITLINGLIDEEQFEEAIAQSVEFHRLLVEVGGNKTMTFLNHILLDLLSRHQREHSKRHPEEVEAHKKKLKVGATSFAKLIDLIEEKDPEAAVAHWRLHLKNGNAAWLESGEAARIVDSLGD